MPLRKFYAIEGDGRGKGQIILGRQSIYFNLEIELPIYQYDYKFYDDRIEMIPSKVKYDKIILPYMY